MTARLLARVLAVPAGVAAALAVDHTVDMAQTGGPGWQQARVLIGLVAFAVGLCAVHTTRRTP